MNRKNTVCRAVCLAGAAAFFVVPATGFLHAQQSATVAELHQPSLLLFSPSSDAPAAPTLNLSTLDLSTLNLSDDGIAYSSSTGAEELTSAKEFVSESAGEAYGQPAPRRRYGRPNYSDKMHNADGSNKISLMIGGGLTVPVGTPSTNYLKTSWKVQGGVGYNFNRKAGIVLQFDYDNFALPGSLINSQTAVYSAQNFTYQGGGAVSFAGLDGHTHDWSFTLNPTYTFYQGDSTGAYAVVGGGFYHKVTDFTLPQTGTYCDYYYGCYQYTANQTFDQYTSNSAGVNGGIGFTYRPSRFASEKLYMEARYVFNFNNQRPGNAINLFPGNSSTTSYIPITIGLKF